MLAFLPSAVYYVMAPLSVSLALWLAFAAAFAVGLRYFGATGSVRLFDAAGLVLFGVMAIYDGFVQPETAAPGTNLVLEGGLLAAILWSMAIRKPFTTQYRWLTGPHEPGFLVRAHTLLTALWATTYAGLAAIDCLTVVYHILAPAWASVLDFLLLAAMLTFTWQLGVYIDKRRGKIPFLGKW
ncbi:MAG: hypothetical protein P4L57_06365 [Rhizomicrobium sp.]|nr:hypothetical protein [Rhizomicrobium sp.]